MTDETIVAVYDTAAHADATVADLKAAGIPESAITMHAQNGGASDATTTTQAPAREQGFWSSLFGGEPDHSTVVYDRSLQEGSTVVSVRMPETDVSRMTEILERHNPVDIDERAAGYGLSQTTTTTRQPLDTSARPAATDKTAVGNGGTIQLSEESLVVGTRVVNRGGTRIRRFVVDKQVEQNVTLQDENVTVERRPVTDGRPVSDAAFTDKTIEMTETVEEAVVGKTARVVEEIALRKEATERTETIRDTVRKEEVEIEQIPGTASSTTSDTMPMRDASATTGATTPMRDASATTGATTPMHDTKPNQQASKI